MVCDSKKYQKAKVRDRRTYGVKTEGNAGGKTVGKIVQNAKPSFYPWL